MAQGDAHRLGLQDGAPGLLRSETGTMHARCRVADIRERNLQVHWPEGNVLIGRGVVEPGSGIPEYSAVVEVLPRGAADPRGEARPRGEVQCGGEIRSRGDGGGGNADSPA